MAKVFDVARSTRMDSRVGLIGGISTFFGDFVAFVAGLKVSFLCFFPSLKIDFQTMQKPDFYSFHHVFCSRCCFILSFTLYHIIIYYRVYKVPCKNVGKDRFNEIFLA